MGGSIRVRREGEGGRRGGVVQRRAEGLDVRVGSPSSRVAPSILCFVHVAMSWPPLPLLYSLVLPTYSPVTDGAVLLRGFGRAIYPSINCRLEVGIGECRTFSVEGGRTSSVCNARGDEGQEDGKVRVLHDCYNRGGGVVMSYLRNWAMHGGMNHLFDAQDSTKTLLSAYN